MRISDWSSDVCSSDLLLAIDYSQIELRLMAHFSGDPRLQAAFRDGLDIHQATAAEVFGLPLDQVGGDQRRAAKARSEERRVGKECVSTCRSRWAPSP